MSEALNKLWQIMSRRFQSHPWHGIDVGADCPDVVSSFIEITPHDSVKYEVDKESGFLKVDRPQKFSNIIPALYGFIPQTYCAQHVAEFCMTQTGKKTIMGDGDPLDICVLTERNITQGNILVYARPIGGFRMIDNGEADDKIIAVLKGDEVYSNWNDLSDCPEAIVNRLRHYFLTYKNVPGEGKVPVEITHVYGRIEAHEVIRRSIKDYQQHFGIIGDNLNKSADEAFKGSKK